MNAIGINARNSAFRPSLALTLCLVLALAACTPQPAPNQPFGASVRMAVASQTADPAPADDTPSTGLDGTYAAGMMRAYQKPARFKTSQAPASGTSSSSSSQQGQSSPQTGLLSGQSGTSGQSQLTSQGSSPLK